jgi:hypothetical protein
VFDRHGIAVDRVNAARDRCQPAGKRAATTANVQRALARHRQRRDQAVVLVRVVVPAVDVVRHLKADLQRGGAG